MVTDVAPIECIYSSMTLCSILSDSIKMVASFVWVLYAAVVLWISYDLPFAETNCVHEAMALMVSTELALQVM